MSTVRFAMLCDYCGQRSDEYTAWPTCRSCMADTCEACAEPGTTEGGDGERVTVLCRACVAEGHDA